MTLPECWQLQSDCSSRAKCFDCVWAHQKDHFLQQGNLSTCSYCKNLWMVCILGCHKNTESAVTTSLALPTLYPKSRVVRSGLFRYAEFWHCDQKLVYPFSALDVTKIERAKAGRLIAVDKDVAASDVTKLGLRMRAINCYAQLRLPRETRSYIVQGQRLRQTKSLHSPSEAPTLRIRL